MRGTGFAQGSVPVADADEVHPELDRTFRNSHHLAQSMD
jgi:hypothetical protein